MPVSLPPGVVGVPEAVSFSGGDPALFGSRVTSFRFELLDFDENLIGELTSVQPGGTLDFTADAAIKGSGKITVTDLGDDIDWLNVRIRPIVSMELANAGDANPGIESPLGVYLASAPVEAWSDTGRRWDVELLDKNSILDSDVVVDEATGDPITFTALAGENIIELVVAQIAAVGESTVAIVPGTPVLTYDMTWDMGTSRLKIVNDLLDAADYFSLFTDRAGQFRAIPFIPAAERSPVYEVAGPFTKGATSLMAPDWSRDRDIYSVPNRYIVIGQGSGTTAAWTSTVTNEDPDSEFSYPSRGRWITAVETGVEAATNDELDAYAARRLAQVTSVTSTLSIPHLFLPDVEINSAVQVINADAELSQKFIVTKTNIPLDPVGLCATELAEAVQIT